MNYVLDERCDVKVRIKDNYYNNSITHISNSINVYLINYIDKHVDKNFKLYVYDKHYINDNNYNKSLNKNLTYIWFNGKWMNWKMYKLVKKEVTY